MELGMAGWRTSECKTQLPDQIHQVDEAKNGHWDKYEHRVIAGALARQASSSNKIAVRWLAPDKMEVRVLDWKPAQASNGGQPWSSVSASMFP